MHIEPTGRKAKCILAMTAAFGGKPQVVIDRIKSLPSNVRGDDSEICRDVGQVVLGDKHSRAIGLNEEVGKFVLGFLKAQEPSDENTWQSLQRFMQDRFLKWNGDPELLKDFSLLMYLPILTCAEHEAIIDELDSKCELENNSEKKVFTKDMRCLLVELPQDKKTKVSCYSDIVYTRGVDFKVTSYAVKDPHDIVLPDLPSEATHYNIAVAKNHNGMWMTSRFVFATNSRHTIKEIHNAIIEEAKKNNLLFISAWLYSGKYKHLIVSRS